MEVWQLWLITGVVLFIFEMFTPSMFLASLGFGSFFASMVAYLGYGLVEQSIIFAFVSVFLIAFIRPFLKNYMTKNGNGKTGVPRYIGHSAKVVEKISATANTGRVRIFDEEWSAASVDGLEIEINENVIVENFKDMTLFVKKAGGD